MHPIRTIARPLMAAPFVAAGIEVLRDPGPRAERAAPLVKPFADRVSWLPADPQTLVRAHGACSVAAGALLALGRLQRLATAVLAAGLVPTLLTEERFWNEKDPQRRAAGRYRMLATAGLVGALLTTARQRTAETRAMPRPRARRAVRRRAPVGARS